ncbi:MAG: helix-turn-helix transcriptional regulator [Synergistaceae bacterium]|jgi:transcriptional regulator with XRE-family HTH domain|nr:helix-turn-helix transcriptional regulator [Synergistaceae bacterium]
MRHRIREARKSLGLNQEDFARQIGLTQTSLSMIEMGNNKVTDKNVKLICVTFNVNEQWLRTGRGPMFNASPYVKEISDIMENLTPETQQYLFLMAKELLNVQEKLLSGLNERGSAPKKD